MSPTTHESDHCDACGAQAFMKATRNGLALYFCGHHGTQYRARLVAEGWVVTDERHLIDSGTRPGVRV